MQRPQPGCQPGFRPAALPCLGLVLAPILAPILVLGWPLAAPAQEPPVPATAEAEAPVADPAQDVISLEAEGLLSSTGLIARQSQLNQSMLLMEGQIRQAELIRQLLSIYGPDFEVEVAPGEFRSFADTAAGLEQRLALLELQRRLAVAEAEAAAPLAPPSQPEPPAPEPPAPAPDAPAGAGPAAPEASISADALEAASALLGRLLESAGAAPPDALRLPDPPAYRLREVAGFNGSYTAVITVDGAPRRVETGDTLPDGARVDEVGADFVRIARGDAITRVTLEE